MVVASRMESSVESIFSLGNYATKLQIKTQMTNFSKRPGENSGRKKNNGDNSEKP
jgi:hypothetical protein